jgi:starch phosphorylase
MDGQESRPQVETNKNESVRIGLSVEAIKQAFADNLAFIQGRFAPVATRNDYYLTLAYTVRDRLMANWIKTAQTYYKKASRTVCYLSAEFLLGPQLGNNLINMGIFDNVKKAIGEMGINLNELIEQEQEPGLGNGGLGRLAACFMDSLATLQIPTIGYGIRYEFGIFNQEICQGWQVESTDKWLLFGNPWEIPRPEISFDVKLGGYTKHDYDEQDRYRVRWVPDRVVRGIAYDTPILGHQTCTANFLRLFRAEACESFDFQAFNVGDYYGAVMEKMACENLTKVLYPNDEPLVGRQLRLQQQYFFVSCALQDMIRIYLQREKTLDNFHKKYAVQLNDTHPSIGVVELMRLLVDEYLIDWEQAWEITQKTFAYTNHTLLPEALEKWPIPLFKNILPRHLEIIYEINRRFLDHVRSLYPGNGDKVARLSLIDEAGERYVRMANLACVGSHAINGVAALHTELLKKDILRDFHELWPEKFSNKTNGVTPRRFLLLSNPRLSHLITEKIGDRWVKNLDDLRKLEKFADDSEFQKVWRQVKRDNKRDLSALIEQRTGTVLDPDSMFDIQAKRIHEYKRQHLNVLHVITLYHRIKQNPGIDVTPRTVIFGGKAAPGYFMARLIIKLINSLSEVINNDSDVKGRLKVVFLPNYNVKNAQWVYPAADLSEQISTAGKEASGTGNMKFALNGALTIGTLDGANIEIREEVGPENFFLFGLSAEEVYKRKCEGYEPQQYLHSNPHLREILGLITSGCFSRGDQNLFKPLVDELTHRDEYMLLADYQSYLNCQDEVSRTYRNQAQWTKRAILNVARMGKFSSDRAIREYCRDIWKVESEPPSL